MYDFYIVARLNHLQQIITSHGLPEYLRKDSIDTDQVDKVLLMCPELKSRHELTQSSSPGTSAPTTSGAVLSIFSKFFEDPATIETKLLAAKYGFRRRMSIIICEDLKDRGVHNPTLAQVRDIWENSHADALFWEEWTDQQKPQGFNAKALSKRDAMKCK